MTPVIGIRMEYVGGGTLQDMVERRVELLQQQPGIEGPGREGKEGGGGALNHLNHRLVHRLLTEMFSALDYLHTVAQLLHRDIKSDNIFVTTAPFGRHIKVCHSQQCVKGAPKYQNKANDSDHPSSTLGFLFPLLFYSN
jgi:serine/threonine protein kinase